jgi:aminoglycoside phosphotransferase family enzyme/predicted kinase
MQDAVLALPRQRAPAARRAAALTAVNTACITGSKLARQIQEKERNPMPTEGNLHAHAALIAALRDPAAYPHPVDAVELIETHISSVLLAGAFAYKLKKPVNLGFADFSTQALRKRYCDEEIRLNRRSAPALYLDVVPITRAGAAGPVRIGGAGTVLDHAVRMRRFDAGARLDHVARAGGLDASMIDRLAASIAAFHAGCEPAGADTPYGSAQSIHDWMRDTTAQLRERIDTEESLQAERARLARIARWSEAEFARRQPVFAARRAAGFVRECHGDLHLANLALVDGAPMAFDCIEFNPALRFIDVMSDVAFTWMDLVDHDLPGQAARFRNAYLERTGDYAGLATLRYYAVYRALVRALVALIRGAQAGAERDEDEHERDVVDCRRYLAVAERLATARPPQLVLVAGVTGTGKTTVAQHLLAPLDGVRVRSDVERKRRAGVPALAHADAPIDAGLYGPASTAATYALLAQAARAILDAGFTAFVDATFQRRADRATLRAVAAEAGARYDLVLCEASAAVLRARVTARQTRGDDASDATPAVLERQLAAFEAPDASEATSLHRLDTDADHAAVARRCAALAIELGGTSPDGLARRA